MLEELIDALLYEGYALYPYTPGATKNATPTPFGILYPPAYAESHPSAFDHLRMDVGLVPHPRATVRAEVRFLQAGTSEGHERGIERRVKLPSTPLTELAGDSIGSGFAFDGLAGTVSMRAEIVGTTSARTPDRSSSSPTSARTPNRSSSSPNSAGRPNPSNEHLARVQVCVHNSTPLSSPESAGRGRALQSSLISTHAIVSAPGSRFESATDHPEWASVNTFPVLATPEDDTMLGATIVLPDHPQIAPESRGSLFDGTEIEEALLLHVHTLSDCEREAIAEGDPAVRAMVERAVATTPEEMLRLHGRLELRDPVEKA